GWKHFQLRHIDGRLLNSLSQVGEYACNSIVKIDEKAGYFYYSAGSDKIPYNAQLHRAKLDGSNPMRLTSSPLNHTSFDISPDHRFIIATREQLDVPPSTVLYDQEGKQVAILSEGNRDVADKLKLPSAELFSFLSDDGKTTIYGTLHKPSNFDPSRKYPLLIDVYGGPESVGISTRYTAANPICELGYLVAKIGNRGTTGRGKAFESATYLKLGGPDMDDQAAGVRFLRQRSYVDGGRVGIFGHSYGGYMSALALLRYPDVFHVAVAGAPVTDFRNYDTIYTERYMQTPAENAEGYDAGSCNKIVTNLKGKLLLVHGLIDDNVHPANTWQLSKALHAADKRFQMMIYPEFQHGIGSTYSSLRWEYFHEHLKP
ncbi:MAG: prolyl oligopeptidase family serine peptidase, partial [Pirellula sp.]